MLTTSFDTIKIKMGLRPLTTTRSPRSTTTHKRLKRKIFSALFMLPYNLFPRLRYERHRSRFRMDASVVLLLLFFIVNRSMFLHVIVNVFRHLSMIGNATNLWMGGIFLFQRFGIIECGSFAWSKLIEKRKENKTMRRKTTTTTTRSYSSQFFRCS